MADQGLDVAPALGRVAGFHRRLDRDLDVLDPPLLVVLGLLRRLGDGQGALRTVGCAVEDGLRAGAHGDAPALAEHDAGRVDVLADGDERRCGGRGHAGSPCGARTDGMGLNWQP